MCCVVNYLFLWLITFPSTHSDILFQFHTMEPQLYFVEVSYTWLGHVSEEEPLVVISSVSSQGVWCSVLFFIPN